ncbi:MAG: TetR/AcrR family transcriptional regulator [Cyclobacteriaceae bacterium]|nr:TetR/AcrR family transcriptional regulator [Cyclobacteriaceae bacterium]
MSEAKPRSAEELIIDSAMKVFTRRGFAAARMEEIAKEAGINRALLHYYFRDKETMFAIIFETRFKEFFSGIGTILQSEKSLFEKIREIVSHEINVLTLHPDLPRFIITEVASQPERLIQYGQKMGINPRMMLAQFNSQVEEAIAQQRIIPIESRQLLMNIMSMCIYPFVAKPIIKTMMQMDENSFGELMEKRKNDVYEFIIKAITP